MFCYSNLFTVYSQNRAPPNGSAVKNSPAMQEMWVQSLWEGPMEKEMATHSSILAWEIPWTEESGGLQSIGSQGVGQDLVTKPQQQQSVCMKQMVDECLLHILIF